METLQIVVSYQFPLLVLQDGLHVVEVAALVHQRRPTHVVAPLDRDLPVLDTLVHHSLWFVVNFRSCIRAGVETVQRTAGHPQTFLLLLPSIHGTQILLALIGGCVVDPRVVGGLLGQFLGVGHHLRRATDDFHLVYLVIDLLSILLGVLLV